MYPSRSEYVAPGTVEEAAIGDALAHAGFRNVQLTLTSDEMELAT